LLDPAIGLPPRAHSGLADVLVQSHRQRVCGVRPPVNRSPRPGSAGCDRGFRYSVSAGLRARSAARPAIPSGTQKTRDMPVQPLRLAPLVLRHRWLLIIMAGLVPLYLIWAANDSIGAIADDGPGYLMMARHFSPYVADSRVNALWAATSRFPPLYPLLLA